MSKNVVVADYGEDFDMRNRRNRQVKMCQLFFYSSYVIRDHSSLLKD